MGFTQPNSQRTQLVFPPRDEKFIRDELSTYNTIKPDDAVFCVASATNTSPTSSFCAALYEGVASHLTEERGLAPEHFVRREDDVVVGDQPLVRLELHPQHLLCLHLHAHACATGPVLRVVRRGGPDPADGLVGVRSRAGLPPNRIQTVRLI